MKTGGTQNRPGRPASRYALEGSLDRFTLNDVFGVVLRAKPLKCVPAELRAVKSHRAFTHLKERRRILKGCDSNPVAFRFLQKQSGRAKKRICPASRLDLPDNALNASRLG